MGDDAKEPVQSVQVLIILKCKTGFDHFNVHSWSVALSRLL